MLAVILFQIIFFFTTSLRSTLRLLSQRCSNIEVTICCLGSLEWLEDTPLVEFIYLVFTHMPGEGYHRWLRSLLLCLCDVFQGLINSLVWWFCTGALGLILFKIVMIKFSNLTTGTSTETSDLFVCLGGWTMVVVLLLGIYGTQEGSCCPWLVPDVFTPPHHHKMCLYHVPVALIKVYVHRIVGRSKLRIWFAYSCGAWFLQM